MPYVIVSTIALAANLYKKSPVIVGDKDADSDLMKFLGAQMTCNYPTCGSPPVFIIHDTPNNVLNLLDKKGFNIQSTEIIQEHLFWVLRRERTAEDEKEKSPGPDDKEKSKETSPPTKSGE